MDLAALLVALLALALAAGAWLRLLADARGQEAAFRRFYRAVMLAVRK